MKLAKQGDTIEWSFGSNYPEYLANKKFTAKVVVVHTNNETYGVYAEYGMDLIPFNKCKIVKES